MQPDGLPGYQVIGISGYHFSAPSALLDLPCVVGQTWSGQIVLLCHCISPEGNETGRVTRVQSDRGRGGLILNAQSEQSLESLTWRVPGL
jgi:hypothetical protein